MNDGMLVIKRLILFGATGDLAGRFLWPALAELYDSGDLPDGFSVIGAATADWDDEKFRVHASQKLERHTAANVSDASREAVLSSLRYRKVDLTIHEALRPLSMKRVGLPSLVPKGSRLRRILRCRPVCFPLP